MCVGSPLRTCDFMCCRLIKESRICQWRSQSAWPPPTQTMPLETCLMPLPMATAHPGPSTSRSWPLNRRRNSSSTPSILPRYLLSCKCRRHLEVIYWSDYESLKTAHKFLSLTRKSFIMFCSYVGVTLMAWSFPVGFYKYCLLGLVP